MLKQEMPCCLWLPMQAVAISLKRGDVREAMGRNSSTQLRQRQSSHACSMPSNSSSSSSSSSSSGTGGGGDAWGATCKLLVEHRRTPE
jgi:hypothetical protein